MQTHRTTRRLGALATLLALVGGLNACGGDDATVDGAALEAEIASSLEAEGLEDVEVSCPEDRAAQQGDTFECTATVGGGRHIVDVEQVSDDGDLEWELDGVVVNRPVIAEIMTDEMHEGTELEVLVDCSDDDGPDVFIGEDGDLLYCGMVNLATNDAVGIEVTVDSTDDRGFTWDVVGDVLPGDGGGTEPDPGAGTGTGTGTVLIDEDFGSPGANARWGTTGGGGRRMVIEDGAFVWTVDQAQSDGFITDHASFASVVDEDVRIDATWGIESPGMGGFLCRLDESREAFAGYLFFSTGTGRVGILKFDGSGGEFENLGSEALPDDLAGGPGVSMTGTCIEQADGSVELTLAVPDAGIVIEATDDSPLPGGQVALILLAFYTDGATGSVQPGDEFFEPFEARWERFTVTVLDG